LGLRRADGGFHPEGYGCISLKHGVVAVIMISMPVWVMVVMVWWWCVCKGVPPSAHGDKGEAGSRVVLLSNATGRLSVPSTAWALVFQAVC